MIIYYLYHLSFEGRVSTRVIAIVHPETVMYCTCLYLFAEVCRYSFVMVLVEELVCQQFNETESELLLTIVL